MNKHIDDESLERPLRACLGDLEPAALEFLLGRLHRVHLEAGETLMAQGDPGDSLYISISGRLRAYVRDVNGVERVVREMTRGQIIGELSMYTGEPRSATVVAIRDSMLVKLDRADFDALLQASPSLSKWLPRQIIHRLQGAQGGCDIPRPVTIGLIPITSGVALEEFCDRLAGHLRTFGRVEIVDAARVNRDLPRSGATAENGADEVDQDIARYLEQLEAANDYVLLVGEQAPTAWTHHCTRRCDEILLLADAGRPPELHDTERQFLLHRNGRTEAAEFLVLLHDAQKRCPAGTRQWLERRPLAGHHHIRPSLERDMARLGRILSGRAIGLVMAGGGARGCAHLGIYRALLERGIDIDFVGGTSIGSVTGVLVASDRPVEEVLRIARESFMANPTGDYTVVPLISIIKGRRLRRIITRAIQMLLGHAAHVEDLWKNFYCVASNYSLASEQVMRHGDLSRALRASIAIPGALPPVIHGGSLLCDGGTFNNFPVDVMRRMRGVGKVIGVDLGPRQRRPIEIDEVPDGWALLRDKLRPRGRRRFRLPSLMGYLMNVTILYSSSRQRENRELTDLYFNPPLERVGMLDWHEFDSIVSQAYQHGLTVLDGTMVRALQETPPPRRAPAH